jgi:hypothetical protein
MGRIRVWDDHYYEIFKKLGRGLDFELHEKIMEKYQNTLLPKTKEALEIFIRKELENEN